MIDRFGKAASGMPQKKARVLIVDDDKQIREFLLRSLSRSGYNVTCANNGHDALSLFPAGSYDLVITDLRMPIINGLELCRLVKKQSPSTPVVVMTGSCDAAQIDQLRIERADLIIPKPFKISELETIICQLLNSRP